jgi:hypothetical protein
MRANPLQGSLEKGVVLKIETILGPKMGMDVASAIWPQKSRDIILTIFHSTLWYRCFYLEGSS